MYVHADKSVAYEGVYNRIIADKIADMVPKSYHVRQVYHHWWDSNLTNRAQMANAVQGTAVLVSIHHNASPDHKGRGFEVWTTRRSNRSDRLATSIFDSVSATMGTLMRYRKDMTDGDPDFESDFQILRQSIHPAVLVECAFFDNAQDWQLMQNKEWQDAMAKAILDGIIKFLN
jgi:N-acetylmuramoyl-L-alanine amidase